MILSHKNLVLEHAIAWNVRSQTCLQKTTSFISETSFNVGVMRVLTMINGDWSNDVNPNGRIYLIERLAKNKWQAKYHDGSTKQFRTLKAARAAGIPKSVTDILTVKRPI